MRLFCPTAQAISAIPHMAISHHLQACDFNHLATVHGVVFRVFLFGRSRTVLAHSPKPASNPPAEALRHDPEKCAAVSRKDHAHK
jgi:hypothetical protein